MLAKVAAILPETLRPLIDHPAVGTLPGPEAPPLSPDVARLREWSRSGKKIVIDYRSEQGADTRRVVWPFMVGYMAAVRVVMAWCELREDYRIFRIDRMTNIDFLSTFYPERSVVLRRRWLAKHARQRQGLLPEPRLGKG